MVEQISPAPTPETIEGLANGVMAAHALLAGMQLDIFSALSVAPKNPENVASVIGADTDKLRLLLYALVVAGMLTVKGDMFSNTPEAAHYLVKGKPTYIGGRHHSFSMLWPNMFSTAESVRTGVAQTKLEFAAMSSEEMENLLRGLQPGSMAAGRSLLERFDFTSHRKMLEVGAGLGGITLVVAAACPDIEVVLADFPAVTSIAQKVIDEANLSHRVKVLPGDAVTDPLGGPYDVVAMKAFIQVLDRDQAQQALVNISRSMKTGGTVYIIGKIVGDMRIEPADAALFNINFLNVYDGGQAYTESEYRGWMTEAGFEEFNVTPVPGGDSIISGSKVNN